MTTTLILGGGFGGLACARALRAQLPEAERILLVDHAADFVVGAAKTWVMLGEREERQAWRSREALLPKGVSWLRAEVVAVDASSRRVTTSAGAFEPDHLVLALGAELDMSLVPGLAEAAHSFYSLEGATRLRDALQAFAGGRLVLLIPRVPFKCPPAPYEAALLLDDALRRRGLRERTELEVWTVEKAPMPTAGSEMGKAIANELGSRGIRYYPSHKAAAVAEGAVRFEDGSEVAYDLLLAIPPHRPAELIAKAGLAEPGGWVPVDPATLEAKKPGVASQLYAIGDLASVPLPGRYDPSAPLVLPKAGVFAAAQGEVVAARIAAQVRGEAPGATFDGKGYCFLEVGGGRALRAEGSFFALPHPVMSRSEPQARLYREKVAWVEQWLGANGV